MRKLIPIVAVLVAFALLFGCTQKGGEQPSGGQPGTQPKVTAAVEDIAADALANEIPGDEWNSTELDNALLNMTG